MIVTKLLPTAWLRLEYYARKIRKLTVRSSNYGTGDKSLFIALATYRPVRNPLQNLQRITMDLESLPYIDSFLSPNVSQISITVRSSTRISYVSLLLPSIPRLCPNLQKFTVDSTLPSNLGFERAAFQTICSMHRMRTLDLGALRPPDGTIGRILHHLGNMTSLETLHNLYLPTEIQSLAKRNLILPSSGMVNHWFPKLRKLSLSLRDFDSAVIIMDSIHPPFISLEFDLSPIGQPKPHSHSKLLQSLACNPHLPLSLSTLVIFESLEHLAHNVSDAESISQPLLALTNLEQLTLQLSGVEMFDDMWLNRASKCFPRLQILQLQGGDSEKTRITLAGYVPLLQNCPRLRLIATAVACQSFNTKKALPAGLDFVTEAWRNSFVCKNHRSSHQ